MSEETPTQPPGEPTSTEAATPTKVARSSKAGRLIVAAIVLTSVAAVSGAIMFSSSTGPDPAAARVPASAAVFAQVTLEAGAEDQANIDALIDRVPGDSDALTAQARLMAASMLSDSGVTLDEIEGWLGAQVAVSVIDPEEKGVFVLIQSDDDVAAAATLEKAPDDFVVDIDKGWVILAEAGSDIEAFKKKAAALPLIRDREFRRMRSKVGGDGSLLGRVLPDKIAGEAAEVLGGFAGLYGHPVVFGAKVTEDGIIATAVGPVIGSTTGGSPELLSKVPANVLGAMSFFDLSGLVTQSLEAAGEDVPFDLKELGDNLGLDIEDTFLSWLGGETTIEVHNVEDPKLVLRIQATDEEKMRSAVATLKGFLRFAGDAIEVTSGEDDFTITAEGMKVGVKIQDSVLSIGLPAGILSSSTSGSTLGDLDAFKRFFGGSQLLSAAGIVNVQSLLSMVPAEVSEYLDIFEAIVLKSSIDAGESVSELIFALEAA